MYDKRIKFAGGTFNDSFTSLDKIQHIHTSICFVKNWLGKPMPTSFYKLTFMQTGMFFNPTVSLGHFIYLIINFTANPRLRTIPLDHMFAMPDIDRSGTAVQSQTPPIPQLESENIRSSTDFENHTITPRTMNSTRRYKYMVVLFHWIIPNILFCIEMPCMLCFGQGIYHLLRYDTFLHSQINRSIFFGIKNVIALVLGIMHTELFLYILCQRMHL